jgi:hypothetical protein
VLAAMQPRRVEACGQGETVVAGFGDVGVEAESGSRSPSGPVVFSAPAAS